MEEVPKQGSALGFVYGKKKQHLILFRNLHFSEIEASGYQSSIFTRNWLIFIADGVRVW